MLGRVPLKGMVVNSLGIFVSRSGQCQAIRPKSRLSCLCDHLEGADSLKLLWGAGAAWFNSHMELERRSVASGFPLGPDLCSAISLGSSRARTSPLCLPASHLARLATLPCFEWVEIFLNFHQIQLNKGRGCRYQSLLINKNNSKSCMLREFWIS